MIPGSSARQLKAGLCGVHRSCRFLSFALTLAGARAETALGDRGLPVRRSRTVDGGTRGPDIRWSLQKQKWGHAPRAIG